MGTASGTAGRKKRRGALVAAILGLAVLGLAAFLAFKWEAVYLWWHGYRIVWLPREVDDSSRMNSAGQVAVTVGKGEDNQPARWSMASGELRLLGTLPEDRGCSFTTGINREGHAIGFSCGPPREFGFFWTEAGGLVALDTLGGSATIPWALNDRDQVVGMCSWSKFKRLAFLWSPGKGLVSLGTLPGGESSGASAINSKGWVAGWADRHPFLWKPETGMRDLGLPPGASGGTARDIDERGEVLVAAGPAPGGSVSLLTRLYLWSEDGGYRELPSPGDFEHVSGIRRNSRGAVLLYASKIVRWSDGTPQIGNGVGFLLDRSLLKRLPVPPGWDSTSYGDLTDEGWLLGVASRKDRGGGKEDRTFILRPVR
jgi:probable HAF family extracellular repeat protein